MASFSEDDGRRAFMGRAVGGHLNDVLDGPKEPETGHKCVVYPLAVWWRREVILLLRCVDPPP